MTTPAATSTDRPLKTAPLIAPAWSLVFLVTGGALLIVIGLAARLFLGLSAASDHVFAVEALLSGVGTDRLLRRLAGRKLVIAPRLEIPFLPVWFLACAYVFLFRPFE